MQKVFVSSEIQPLKRVITHRPDSGVGRVSPKHADELLFDDIVFLPQMQSEHDTFTAVLRAFLGAENVLEVSDLLEEALRHSSDKQPRKKKVLIEEIARYEELPDQYCELLMSLDDKSLTETLVSGYCEDEDLILFPPVPNFIFTRDIAVTVKDHVIITKAAKEARQRENLLTRFIFWAHPLFAEMHDEGYVINLNDINAFPPSRKGDPVSIEGGDMMMVHPDYLLVGSSERTTDHAINLLCETLFEKNIVRNVVQINIPAARSWMHIDTLFTQVDVNHVVAYKPFVMEGKGVNVKVHRQDGSARVYPSVKEFFLQEINANMEFIPSGGGVSPYQEREQWTDGCNLVAIRPGVALTYDRNVKTGEAFQAAGYQLLGASDFLAGVADGSIDPHKLKRTIITLPSGELSRARGGSHCMTCPIERSL